MLTKSKDLLATELTLFAWSAANSRPPFVDRIALDESAKGSGRGLRRVHRTVRGRGSDAAHSPSRSSPGPFPFGGFDMRIVPTLLAAGLVFSASSAFAAAKSKDAKQPEAPSAAASQSAADAQRKYCIEEESYTGSRLYNRQCLTKAEWAKHGVDVDDQSKPD